MNKTTTTETPKGRNGIVMPYTGTTIDYLAEYYLTMWDNISD